MYFFFITLIMFCFPAHIQQMISIAPLAVILQDVTSSKKMEILTATFRVFLM